MRDSLIWYESGTLMLWEQWLGSEDLAPLLWRKNLRSGTFSGSVVWQFGKSWLFNFLMNFHSMQFHPHLAIVRGFLKALKAMSQIFYVASLASSLSCIKALASKFPLPPLPLLPLWTLWAPQPLNLQCRSLDVLYSVSDIILCLSF